MLPAEIQRIVLLICLAATGYLLILAWNEDMQDARDGEFYAAEPAIVASQSAVDYASDDVPVAVDSLVPGDDIPALPSAAFPEDGSVKSIPTRNSDRLITVTTPSLKVWIDREGGDVVRVLLPKFPVEIDRPEVPFVLLDQSQQRTYIAQSGLIGADGTDRSGQRPLYRSDKANFRIDRGETEVVLRANIAGNPVAVSYTHLTLPTRLSV